MTTKRLPLLALVSALACSGGGSGEPSGPKTVASVSVAAPSTTVNVGQQVTLSFTAHDASGAAVAGKTAIWSSSATQFATVSSDGTVLGVAPGSVTITATVDGKAGSQPMTVTNPSGCAAASPLTLQVGEARLLTGADRANICLSTGTGASEYMLLAFNNSLDTTGKTATISIGATGTAQAFGAPASAALREPGPAALHRRPARNAAFDAELRRLETVELGAALRRTGRASAYERMRASAQERAETGRGALKGVVGVPAIGTLVTLNTRSNTACSNPTLNTGRVVAVSATAIIIADTLAPVGGFTTEEYAAFATTFDTLVFPLDTAAFGAPSDLDANGRVVIFFTQAVNQLTARGATSVIGGFFFARDLFPVAGNASLGLEPCAASNEAEMFYVPVVDPTEIYNQYFKNKATMQTDLLSSLAHEFEHLINAGRRAYINEADDFEKTWLNEGLAHLAEELLYFRISGLPLRSNLTLSQITASQQLVNAINSYQVDNFLRLGEYMKAPSAGSPYKTGDELATRGAAWQFLRYVGDQATGNENVVFKALVNSKANGMANLSAVVSPMFTGGISAALRSWALAQFLDDTGISTDPLLGYRTWNFRSVLTGQIGFTGFPLSTVPLLDGGSQNVVLPAGGALYMRFRVNAGVSGSVVPATLPAVVDLVLVRTQ